MTDFSRRVLQEINALGVFHDKRHTVDVEHEGVHLTCELQSADRLSCAVLQLKFAAPSHGLNRYEQLQPWGERLCSRLTYLMEPLKPIEVDRLSHQLRLRSSPPQRHERTSTYYDLLLSAGGQLELRRQSWDAQQHPNATVPCQFTKEALAKLADDLVASLA